MSGDHGIQESHSHWASRGWWRTGFTWWPQHRFKGIWRFLAKTPTIPKSKYIQLTPLRVQLSQEAYGRPCMGRPQCLQLEYDTGATRQGAELGMWMGHLQFLPHFPVLLFTARFKGTRSVCKLDGYFRRQGPVGIMLYFEMKWKIKISPMARLAQLPGRGGKKKGLALGRELSQVQLC